ncbi:MAG TPA: DUF2087 domain-containing protein [Bacillota bacterium]|nr:DUF2087 domain-containing protein [Bacillota bacterium]
MNNEQPITKEYFIKRLIDLCLRSGLSGYPTDIVDQHILFKSAALSLDISGAVTEKEVNEKLKNWIINISRIKNIDHGTLRRRLVDAGYLTRTKDGSSYQVTPSRTRSPFFDESIEQVNVMEIIQTGREEIARRKREYLEKSNGQAPNK